MIFIYLCGNQANRNRYLSDVKQKKRLKIPPVKTTLTFKSNKSNSCSSEEIKINHSDFCNLVLQER